MKRTKKGRPRIAIDARKIEQMASWGLSAEKIGLVLGCSRATLEANFSAPLKRGRAQCDYRLHTAQIKLALSGNATMLIWLGKQRLGQSDHPRNDDGEVRTITVTVVRPQR
jgi:hypothetical protein